MGQPRIEFQNWKDVSKNMDNTVQFHLGGIIDISRFSNIRLGFFTQNDAYTDLSEIINQYFLTAGIQTGNENIMFHLSVLDSHLFKREESTLNKEFHQTIISLGGTYMIEWNTPLNMQRQ